MLDSNINIRSEPSLQGQIIDRLNLHDKIQVLEAAGDWQIIDNIHSRWYKIKHNNLIGYIWGGYIARKSLIFDIDNNGIMDYFYYRTSYISPMEMIYAVLSRDIIIYFNNRKIDTTNIINTTNDHEYDSYPDWVEEWGRPYSGYIGFEKINGRVRISLFNIPYEYHDDEPYVYRISEYLFTGTGEIEYLGIREEDFDYIEKYF